MVLPKIPSSPFTGAKSIAKLAHVDLTHILAAIGASQDLFRNPNFMSRQKLTLYARIFDTLEKTHAGLKFQTNSGELDKITDAEYLLFKDKTSGKIPDDVHKINTSEEDGKRYFETFERIPIDDKAKNNKFEYTKNPKNYFNQQSPVLVKKLENALRPVPDLPEEYAEDQNDPYWKKNAFYTAKFNQFFSQNKISSLTDYTNKNLNLRLDDAETFALVGPSREQVTKKNADEFSDEQYYNETIVQFLQHNKKAEVIINNEDEKQENEIDEIERGSNYHLPWVLDNTNDLRKLLRSCSDKQKCIITKIVLKPRNHDDVIIHYFGVFSEQVLKSDSVMRSQKKPLAPRKYYDSLYDVKLQGYLQGWDFRWYKSKKKHYSFSILDLDKAKDRRKGVIASVPIGISFLVINNQQIVFASMDGTKTDYSSLDQPMYDYLLSLEDPNVSAIHCYPIDDSSAVAVIGNPIHTQEECKKLYETMKEAGLSPKDNFISSVIGANFTQNVSYPIHKESRKPSMTKPKDPPVNKNPNSMSKSVGTSAGVGVSKSMLAAMIVSIALTAFVGTSILYPDLIFSVEEPPKPVVEPPPKPVVEPPPKPVVEPPPKPVVEPPVTLPLYPEPVPPIPGITSGIPEAIVESLSDKPHYISADISNNVFIAIPDSDVIEKYDQNGKPLDVIDSDLIKKLTGQKFDSPTGVSIDDHFNIYISDTLNNRIVVLDKNKELVSVIDEIQIVPTRAFFENNNNFNKNQFGVYIHQTNYYPEFQKSESDEFNIFNLTFNENSQIHYVVDDVFSYPISGQYLKTSNLNLDQPRGISVDEEGKIFVADFINNRILKLDLNGNLLLSITSVVSAEGEKIPLDRPRDVKIGPKGEIIVADTGSNNVHKFDFNGEFVFTLELPENEITEFRTPMGVEIDDLGNIFVVDSHNHLLHQFGPDGNHKITYEFMGEHLDGFFSPRSMSVSNDGTVFIVDEHLRIVKIPIFVDEICYPESFSYPYSGFNMSFKQIMEKANSLMERGHNVLGAIYYRIALGMDYDNHHSLNGLGYSQSLLCRYAGLSAFEKSLEEVKSNNPNAKIGKGNYYLLLAEKEKQELKRDGLSDSRIRVMITPTLQDALYWFNQVDERNQPNINQLNGLGITYLNLNNFQFAIEKFDESYQLDNTRTETLVGYGKALIKKFTISYDFDLFRLAKSFYYAALDLEPYNSSAQEGLLEAFEAADLTPPANIQRDIIENKNIRIQEMLDEADLLTDAKNYNIALLLYTNVLIMDKNNVHAKSQIDFINSLNS